MSDCCSLKSRSAIPERMACPENGAPSKRVDNLTLKRLVRKLPLGMPEAQYYFCDAPNCDVVYFAAEAEAPIFRCEDLLVRVGPKEVTDPIPVCYCFGFSRKDIVNEIAETESSTVANRITTEVKSGHCACEVKNPSGNCCLSDVRRTAKEILKVIAG